MIPANKIFHGPERDKYLIGTHKLNKINHILNTRKLIYAHTDEIIWI